MGLGSRIRDWYWGFGIGILDKDWGFWILDLGLGGIWDLRLGLELGFGIGICHWDLQLEFGIED